jgi:tryptophan synthase alpha chain
MSRIAETFARAAAAGRAALVPYLTAGDPDLATTHDCVLAAVDAGADAIELGVPFSDPMADGPVIQRSSARALAAGTSLRRVLELVGELRQRSDVPIVLFGYYNPFMQYGLTSLARDAKAAGADGFLCVDAPPEESGELRAAAEVNDLDVIALLAPTTPVARVRTIARTARGFLYFVSVLGVTGARDQLPAELPEMVARVRRVTTLPIGVGFGVQTPAQAGWVASFADAVIVGSAIVRQIETAAPGDAPGRVGELVAALRDGMRAANR